MGALAAVVALTWRLCVCVRCACVFVWEVMWVIGTGKMCRPTSSKLRTNAKYGFSHISVRSHAERGATTGVPGASQGHVSERLQLARLACCVGTASRVRRRLHLHLRFDLNITISGSGGLLLWAGGAGYIRGRVPRLVRRCSRTTSRPKAAQHGATVRYLHAHT